MIKGQNNEVAENFYTSCDFVLFQLYMKTEIISGFPDVPSDVVRELEKLKFIEVENSRCFITKQGEIIVRSGGLKKYLDSQKNSSGPMLNMTKKKCLLIIQLLLL